MILLDTYKSDQGVQKRYKTSSDFGEDQVVLKQILTKELQEYVALECPQGYVFSDMRFRHHECQISFVPTVIP